MKNINSSALLKLFIVFIAVMCLYGCVVVNYFDFNIIRPSVDLEFFEFETDEDPVEYIETTSYNLNSSGIMSINWVNVT